MEDVVQKAFSEKVSPPANFKFSDKLIVFWQTFLEANVKVFLPFK